MANSSPAKVTSFKKLCSGRTSFARIKLYEGPTYLLHVQAALGEERYRRLYYRDIEALFIVRSWGVTIALGVVLLLAGIPTLIGMGLMIKEGVDSTGIILVGIPSFGILMGLAVNLFGGGTGKIGIRTPVSEELVVNTSYGKAKKLVAKIRAMALSSQQDSA